MQAAAPGLPGVAVTESGAGLGFGRWRWPRRARLLAVPHGVCYLRRDIGHAIGLRERLAGAQRVLVVGGGFIGLEVGGRRYRQGKAGSRRGAPTGSSGAWSRR